MQPIDRKFRFDRVKKLVDRKTDASSIGRNTVIDGITRIVPHTR